MKNILILSFGVICLMFTSCGKNMYKTMSYGKDNVAYITVLRDGAIKYADNAVVVVVDGVECPYGKVEKVKNKRKAQPIIVEAGKHNLKVVVEGETVSDENVFLGLQETRLIVIR